MKIQQDLKADKNYGNVNQKFQTSAFKYSDLNHPIQEERQVSTRTNQISHNNALWGNTGRRQTGTNYTETFGNPWQAFEFPHVGDQVVSEEAEEQLVTKSVAAADELAESLSDESKNQDEVQTPLPKYEQQESVQDEDENAQPEAEEGGEQVVEGEEGKPDAENEKVLSQKSTLRLEAEKNAKEHDPIVQTSSEPKKVAVETRSIFSRSYRSRKSTSVRNHNGPQSVISQTSRMQTRKKSLGRPSGIPNQDIFETVSHISKSSGRLHQTNKQTLANQRDLKHLG